MYSCDIYVNPISYFLIRIANQVYICLQVKQVDRLYTTPSLDFTGFRVSKVYRSDDAPYKLTRSAFQPDQLKCW